MMTNSTMTIDKNKCWYKQFWPWFLIFLPSSVVIASIITIILAVQGADSLVSDDYYKQGKLINKNLRKIEYAKKIGLSGGLSIKDNQLQLNVSVREKTINLPPVLMMSFIHPASADKDLSITLIESTDINSAEPKTITGTDYTSQKNIALVKLLSQGAWYVRLLPLDKTWQLNGKIKNNIKTIPLHAD